MKLTPRQQEVVDAIDMDAYGPCHVIKLCGGPDADRVCKELAAGETNLDPIDAVLSAVSKLSDAKAIDVRSKL